MVRPLRVDVQLVDPPVVKNQQSDREVITVVSHRSRSGTTTDANHSRVSSSVRTGDGDRWNRRVARPQPEIRERRRFSGSGWSRHGEGPVTSSLQPRTLPGVASSRHAAESHRSALRSAPYRRVMVCRIPVEWSRTSESPRRSGDLSSHRRALSTSHRRPNSARRATRPGRRRLRRSCRAPPPWAGGLVDLCVLRTTERLGAVSIGSPPHLIAPASRSWSRLYETRMVAHRGCGRTRRTGRAGARPVPQCVRLRQRSEY
jgi:hypothetical protein